jgi:pimeloyl-ACP methyl ester carboxylesterase
MAALMAALLDALDVPRAPVVGHSLGALVALALAGAYPGRVPAAVLLDPPVDPGRRNPDVEQVSRLRHAPPGELEAYLAEGANASLVARALAGLYRQADDAVFDGYLASPPGAPWAWDAAPRVTVPVLVVQADPAEGGVLGDEVAGDFVARLPRGLLVRLAGAGHAVHATRPVEAAEAVREFLEESAEHPAP